MAFPLDLKLDRVAIVEGTAEKGLKPFVGGGLPVLSVGFKKRFPKFVIRHGGTFGSTKRPIQLDREEILACR